jgi:hypothetical protein
LREIKGLLKVTLREKPEIVAIGGSKECVELGSGHPAIAVSVGAVEEQRSRRGVRRSRREVEVGSAEYTVARTVEASEVDVGPSEFGAAH